MFSPLALLLVIALRFPAVFCLISSGAENCTFPLNAGVNFRTYFHVDPSTNQTKILDSVCMTLDSKDKDSSRVVVGLCKLAYTNYSYLASMVGKLVDPVCSSAELNDVFCSPTQRNGTLCGQCKSGYAINVNSPVLECMPLAHCSDVAWLLYLVEQYLPLTGLFLFIMVLQVSLFSPCYRTMVLLGQMVALPIDIMSIDYGVILAFRSSSFLWMSKILNALYDPLNLNVPSFLLPRNCFSSNWNILHVIFLEYLKAIYPLILCAVLYVLIELHGSNCKLVVLAWKPFSRCVVRIRRCFSPKTSVIDAFATFILLSYTKFTMVSVFALLPVSLWDSNGTKIRKVLFVDGNIDFLGSYHLKFVFLVFVLSVIFILLPLTFFLFYHTQPFRKLLRKCHLQSLALMTFIDIFQGHYKDGTNGTQDLRFFSGIYFIFQLFLVSFRCLDSIGEEYVFYSTVVCLVFSGLFFCVKPYKQQRYNILDGMIFLCVAAITCLYLLLQSKNTCVSCTKPTLGTQIEFTVIYLSLFMPALFFAVVMVKSLCKFGKNHHEPFDTESGLESSFADRLIYPNTYKYQFVNDSEMVSDHPASPQ